MSDQQGHTHPAPRGAAFGEPTAHECADYIDQIVYLIDNELDETDIDEVKGHLDTCGPCLEKYDLQMTVKQVVARSCRESVPDDMRARVLVRLREVQVRITES